MGTELRSSTVLEVSDGRVWDAFVEQAPDSTVMHAWAWRDVVENTYGHGCHYLGVYAGPELRGVLPLVSISSKIFGRRLVSMPYGEGGGPSALDAGSERALFDAAIQLALDARATLDVRCVGERPVDLPMSLDKVGMVLDLARSADEAWIRLPSERRNRIKKAEREGLTASVHGPEALGDFYAVFARNMRDLGSPVHAKRFFEEILARFAERARFVVVRAGSKPVGAALMLRHHDTVVIPWVSSLREYFPKCPNQLLYWRAIEHGIQSEAKSLDFGRSSVGAGTYEAKRQWGARTVPLYWYHYPDDGGSSADNATRYDVAMRTWRRLPLRVANVLGPRLRGSISN